MLTNRACCVQVNADDSYGGRVLQNLGGLPLGWVPLADSAAYVSCDGLLASGTVVVTKAELDAGPVRLTEFHHGIESAPRCGESSLYETQIWLDAGHGLNQTHV